MSICTGMVLILLRLPLEFLLPTFTTLPTSNNRVVDRNKMLPSWLIGLVMFLLPSWSVIGSECVGSIARVYVDVVHNN